MSLFLYVDAEEKEPPAKGIGCYCHKTKDDLDCKGRDVKLKRGGPQKALDIHECWVAGSEEERDVPLSHSKTREGRVA